MIRLIIFGGVLVMLVGCRKETNESAGVVDAASKQACLEKLESANPSDGWSCASGLVAPGACRDALKVASPGFDALAKMARVCGEAYCSRFSGQRPLQCDAPDITGHDQQTILNVADLVGQVIAHDAQVPIQRARVAVGRFFSESTGLGRSLPPMNGREAPVLSVSVAPNSVRANGREVTWSELGSLLAQARKSNPETRVVVNEDASAGEASVRVADAARSARLDVSIAKSAAPPSP